MLRLFAALPVPNDVADAITCVQRGLEGAKWSPRQNLHITLRFIGDVNERQAEDIDAALGEILAKPFELELAHLGTFGGDAPHAMWLGVMDNPSLLALQKQCERACRRSGLAPDSRVYTPHLTICYLPRHPDLASVMAYQQHNNLFTAPSWTADRYYLYASRTTGPGPSRYSLEAEYPLIK